MQQPKIGNINGVLAIIGGSIWVYAGIVLSMRPPGNPPASFRATTDMMPHLAMGLLLIGTAIGSSILYFERKKSLKLYRAAIGMIIGSVCYAAGRLIRNRFLEGIGWEPLMPLGFLGFIICCGLIGIFAIKARIFPKVVSYLILTMALCLLLFNDQFLPWIAIPFGVTSITLGMLLIQKFMFIRYLYP